MIKRFGGFSKLGFFFMCLGVCLCGMGLLDMSFISPVDVYDLPRDVYYKLGATVGAVVSLLLTLLSNPIRDSATLGPG